ncbi:MAG: AsnC family transcriptional regulator [Proteobacteria bacterium]|nr:MAG: AsnC family transcriptional regulator [Pseudomonadota bacterium]
MPEFCERALSKPYRLSGWSGMLRFSEGVNLAIHAMGYLAHRDDGPVTAPLIAEELGVSRDHLKKILQRLAKVGLLTSQRGPRGGFMLAHPATEITLFQVVCAIEGDWQPPHCIFGGSICEGACTMHEITKRLHSDVRSTLEGTTLDALPELKEM